MHCCKQGLEFMNIRQRLRSFTEKVDASFQSYFYDPS
jgi:hypothetical protein